MKLVDDELAERSYMTLSHDVFARRAEDVLAMIDRLRAESSFHEAITEVAQRYVEDERHPDLQRFSDVLAMARRQALLQDQLDDDREQLHHGGLSHDELVSTGHHYEMLRHEACEYNHKLRGLIESCRQYFARDELTGWLVSASQGRAQWAQAEVTGAMSEVALHAALQGMPELAGLRYATVEEDLAGYDFMGQWQGKLLTIDAKTGYYQPLTERKHGHLHLEVSVPRQAVKDFRVTRRGLSLLRREVQQALYVHVDVAPPREQGHFRPHSWQQA